ncbi:FAD-dependent oxidoreductase [Oceaniovalibus sp. ACAM 378]|uniref:GcvT family protein n=1 Tax=Oceaniovalibus sp. ACAM 378 TaxID=2599923 RepID=UPI0011D501E6|nr:FAD-dependent oxidoreductase [Oceaniovalibus sp. ACAM 378]TYB89153.1 FAD-dependent oxidoreductase [Oceaniovalibus sp. ACAM 378]
MTGFPKTARVLVIGGGVVGVSLLYHLAKAGWTDCVLVEKNELTAGSTWHAAGNCPNFSASWAVMNMQRYSLAMYRTLADDVDYPMNYHVTGSLRLGHGKERMREFERVVGMGRYQGLEMDILLPAELRERHPFLETHDIAGGLWDPLDGDIDPAQLTQAMAKGARRLGARIERFCPATGVSREGGEWVVHTGKGDIRCEVVVNAAGYYAGRVGDWFLPFGGRRVPMTVMSHQYFLTEEIPEIAAWSTETGRNLPLLRDVDSSWYLRQEKNGLNLGPYERNCKAHWVTPGDPMPDDFSFQLYPDDLDRLEWYIGDAMERIPLLGTAGVGRTINGPIPYAPDGLPMIGPMPGVRGAYEAHSFTFGIVQAGGAGKVLAEWITQGHTEWDMWAVDPRRFTAHADADFCLAKAVETYGHEYAMHFPHREWPAGRDRKLSALHDRLLAAGGQMGAYNGWERANWFAAPGEVPSAAQGDDTSDAAMHTWARSGPWESRVRAECEAVRDSCGIIAISGFTRLNVKGTGAREFINGLTASAMPKPGRIGLAYFPDSRGRVVTEMSVIVHGEDEVGLIGAAMAQWHDAELLWRQAPEGLTVTDHTEAVECLLVTGPRAREILAGLSDHDLSLPWLTVQHAGQVAGVDCALVRVSFAGELGWEIHCAPGDAPAIWDAVTAAGAVPFGMYALNALRLEKGYRAWKGDLSTDYTLLESGLERFIKPDKPVDFPGKAALLAERKRGRSRGFVTLLVDAGDCDAPYMSTLWQGDTVVGETTSGGWGYRVGHSIALGMVRADLAVAGTVLEVKIFGEKCRAVVQPDRPLWDPDNVRIRA